MNVATDSIQPMGPQFVSHKLPSIDTLDENNGIWIPANRIIRTTNITHGSTSDHNSGQGTVIGDSVRGYIEENYKTYFEIWKKKYKLQSKRENIKMSQPPMDSNPVIAKKSDTKTLVTDSSARKVK